MYGQIDHTYIIFIIPALLFSLYAQSAVKRNYNNYSQVFCKRNMTGYDIARFILDSYHLQHIQIHQIPGMLTDHYDPRTNIVNLSQGVYHSTSIAAIGVAAHECGHAVQHAQGYFPISVRSAIIPITNIGSKAALPILLIGFIFGFGWLVNIGILLFSLMALFQLVTLPVEFNASNRAIRIIQENQLLTPEEQQGAKKVLSAAALTYVAALASTLAQILRLITLNNRNRR